MKKIPILVLAFILALPAQYLAQFKKVQDFYSSSPGFEVQFDQAAGGSKMAAGKLYIKKGGKMRVELKNLIIATDGKTAWNYQKASKKLIISNFSDEDESLLSFNRVVYQYPANCNVKESSENGFKVFTLTPNKQMSFSALKCIVNADYSVDRLEITDNAGHTIALRFTNWKFTAPAESLFSIEPAKGDKVIDLRQ